MVYGQVNETDLVLANLTAGTAYTITITAVVGEYSWLYVQVIILALYSFLGARDKLQDILFLSN